MTLLAASSFSYADIALIAVLALALIIGLIRGFSKSFKGLFLTIAVVIISLFIVVPTFTSVRTLDVCNQLDTKITQGISGEEFMNMPIYVEIDATTGERTFYVQATAENGETEHVALDNALGSGLTSKAKAKFATWLAQRFIVEDGQTLGDVGGDFLTDIVISAIMFVAYCIALGLLCWLLRVLFGRMHHSDSTAIRTVDRVFGGVGAIALTALFILVVLAIIAKVVNTGSTVDSYLSNSAVCGYLYQHNPLTQLWTKIFG